jgi:hypothetical protein
MSNKNNKNFVSNQQLPLNSCISYTLLFLLYLTNHHNIATN